MHSIDLRTNLTPEQVSEFNAKWREELERLREILGGFTDTKDTKVSEEPKWVEEADHAFDALIDSAKKYADSDEKRPIAFMALVMYADGTGDHTVNVNTNEFASKSAQAFSICSALTSAADKVRDAARIQAQDLYKQAVAEAQDHYEQAVAEAQAKFDREMVLLNKND